MTSRSEGKTGIRHRRLYYLAATAILLLAAALRLVALHDIPPGLAQDEVMNATIAGLIRQGQHALFFREGFGHEPLYHYLSVPFQWALGDNVLSIRLPAVFLGLLLVALLIRWTREQYGAGTALIAGTALSISWWPIIFSRVGLRPILEPVLLVFAVLWWPRRPWLAGLALGLAVYSYTAARYIFLLPLLFAFYLFFRKRFTDSPAAPFSVRSSLLIFALAAVLYLPLALTLRADPALQQRVGQLFGPLEAAQQGDWQPLWETTSATLGIISFTGDPRWTYSVPGRPLFDPFTSLFVYGGLVLALWKWRQPRFALLLLWLLLALLPSALTPQAPSTVRLIGAIPVIYLLPGLSIAWLWRRSQRAGRSVLLVGCCAALLLLNLGRTVNDGFLRWPAALETRDKYQTVFFDIARHWQDNPAPGLVVADAYYDPIDTFSLNRNLGSNAAARWIQTGQVVAGALVVPATGGNLYLPEYAPLPESLLDAAGLTLQPFYRSPNRPSFAVYSLPPASRLSLPEYEHPLTFDNRLTFFGYRLLPEKAEATLELLTFWRVEAPLPEDLTSFVHLIQDETLVSQHDGLDVAPSTLQPGDFVIQYHQLPLPSPSEKPYLLQAGLYTRQDGMRLQHTGVPADRIILVEPLTLDE